MEVLNNLPNEILRRETEKQKRLNEPENEEPAEPQPECKSDEPEQEKGTPDENQNEEVKTLEDELPTQKQANNNSK